MKLIKKYELRTYRHSELSPGVWFILPFILIQRDAGIRPKEFSPLMLFVGWWKWQIRIDLNL